MERNSRKLIKMLEADGWVRVAVKGDHWQFKHPEKPGRVTVPHPNKDIKAGTVMSIYRQAGWR
ncbi:type II toxin-antitoxin HicA family toxin [Paracoccus phage vB_PbeS_Pben1]|uniref:Putative RNA binding protein YcfA (HicA-like mRNA interferase family) n=1 Tax=Paracoccus versutus TaxID=34007 RepID=A0A3D9XPC3_PARVE|nr:type II toxin-antitoxin system HicA family toxin [Paracoccus versutus]AZV00183.1 type II toxin-antitoxin HicA family toxin [Paracoccus phage vB_PbeS_Pben1]REF72296.1 putative RNA binding protein YcfA (HicA-like mRNA interferase family) [Paracoccus versutus]WGR55721.1 type II toxin-antitoxin system HicA family toxin [Paracoccus versutus]